jgi:hypothetical protein
MKKYSRPDQKKMISKEKMFFIGQASRKHNGLTTLKILGGQECMEEDLL